MRRSFLTYTLAILCSLASADCGSFACTEVGCYSGVSIKLAGLTTKFASDLPLSIHACIDGSTCFDVDVTETECSGSGAFDCFVDGGNVTLDLHADIQDTATHAVHVTVKGKGGTTLFDDGKSAGLKESQPNGEGCEPTCYTGSIELTP